jgi:hypothetical protein
MTPDPRTPPAKVTGWYPVPWTAPKAETAKPDDAKPCDVCEGRGRRWGLVCLRCNGRP